jgi:hypothetical protein
LGSGGIDPRILWPRLYMEVSGQLHVLAALPPGKEPMVPMRLGGPQSRSGHGEEKNPHHRRESNPRTPIVQPVAQRYTDWAITVHEDMSYV